MIIFFKLIFDIKLCKEYETEDMKNLILREFKAKKLKSLILYLPKLQNEEKIAIFRNLNKIIGEVYEIGN